VLYYYIFLIPLTMAGGKRSSDGKEEPSRKRHVIDFETKMKIIHKHEGGQTITSIARELGYAPSTINTIVKDAVCIRDHAKGTATIKATIITKRRERAISEMEELLSIWMEDKAQKRVSLSMQLVQAKAKSLF
jgi:transposase-like protein